MKRNKKYQPTELDTAFIGGLIALAMIGLGAFCFGAYHLAKVVMA